MSAPQYLPAQPGLMVSFGDPLVWYPVISWRVQDNATHPGANPSVHVSGGVVSYDNAPTQANPTVHVSGRALIYDNGALRLVTDEERPTVRLRWEEPGVWNDSID